MQEIVLSTGNKVKVSDEDYEYLNQWAWNLIANRPCRNVYLTDQKRWIQIVMAFVVAERIGLIHSQELDHKDQDKLNNQRSNLRAATTSQNQANRSLISSNTSGYKGVSFHKSSNKWNARLRFQGRLINLGYFQLSEDAAKAYDKAALRYFGEFASLNFK